MALNFDQKYVLKGIQAFPSAPHRIKTHGEDKQIISSFRNVGISKLYVTNLAEKTKECDLLKFFSYYGIVDDCHLREKNGKKYGLITFEIEDNALKVLRNDNNYLDGKKLIVIPVDWRHQPGYELLTKEIVNGNREEITPKKGCNIINKLNDDCLLHIFNFLPIVDKVRAGGVCKRWQQVSQESWKRIRRLDVNSSAWGWRSAHIGTFDLYKVLKRCGRYLETITFFEENFMMNTRTIYTIGQFCPNLKVVYLGTLELMPVEIFFLFSVCPNIEFLQFDNENFADKYYSLLFKRSEELNYVYLKYSLTYANCLRDLPESVETLVYHINHHYYIYHTFHEDIQRLKNLKNLYLMFLRYDGAPKKLPFAVNHKYGMYFPSNCMCKHKWDTLRPKKEACIPIQDYEDDEFHEYYEFSSDVKWAFTRDRYYGENESEHTEKVPDILNQTISNCNANLRSLQLFGFNPREFSTKGLLNQIDRFNELVRLDLTHMFAVDDEIVRVITNNCQKLKVLILRGCYEVTNTGIGFIAAQLPELTHLSVASMPKITGKHLKVMSKLKFLHCSFCLQLKDKKLIKLIRNAPELEQLDIEFCGKIRSSLINMAGKEVQNRTNDVELRIFAFSSGVNSLTFCTRSKLLKVYVHHRRNDGLDSFVDSELGTDLYEANGLHLRESRGMVFEKSIVPVNIYKKVSNYIYSMLSYLTGIVRQRRLVSNRKLVAYYGPED